MSRQKFAGDVLRAASKHLRYEWVMFTQMRKEWASLKVDAPAGIRQAVMESFALHARVLRDVFYKDSDDEDDVVASDFVPNWAAVRPTFESTLPWRQINKDMTHLTYTRLERLDADREWKFEPIYAFLEKVIDTFQSHARPLGVLDATWDQGTAVRSADLQGLATANVATSTPYFHGDNVRVPPRRR